MPETDAKTEHWFFLALFQHALVILLPEVFKGRRHVILHLQYVLGLHSFKVMLVKHIP